jgi:Flp pilus assembly protein TadD
MEAQVTTNDAAAPAPTTEQKKPLLKRVPKWALYTTAGAIAAAVIGVGYTQNWFAAKPAAADEAQEVAAVSSHAPAAAPAGTEDQLMKARQAYASGNVAAAIGSYREILSANPQDVNAMGELGNVLYTIGNTAEASRLYYGVAVNAIQEGRIGQAEALVQVISEHDPTAANELEHRIFDAGWTRGDDGFLGPDPRS